MTAVTQAFDPAVTSPVGDFWQFAVAQTASSAAFSLFVINPGQTRVIDATIRPAAAPGTVVRGTLYVDDFEDSMSFLSGSQLAALRYEYKVG
jgi:restriction endonuclease Mrr